MANFVNEKYNSMPEQVEENKHNIKELIKFIKPVYKSLIALTIATTSIAIASTNASDDTTSGWLIDENGLFFHITNGDGTNLLIEYYANVKGEKGDTGETGATGATGARGYGIHYTSDEYDLTILTYNKSNISINAPINPGDIIVFKNGYIDVIYGVQETQIILLSNTAVKLDIGSNVSNYITYITPYYDAQEELYRLPLSDILDTKDDENPVNPEKLQMGDIIICLNQISQIQGYYLYSAKDTTEAFFYNKLEIPLNIPTITLENSQMIDQTHVQLNQSQYSLIKNNGVVNIVLPTQVKYTFVVNNLFGTYTLTLTKGSSVEITFFTIEIDDQTRIATLYMGDFQNKQLYQHNIKIDIASTFRATIILISDNSNAFNYTSLKTYLTNKGFTNANYLLNAIGFYYENNIYYNIFGVCTQNNEIRFFGAKDNNLGGFNITNSYNIYDNVIAL